MLGNHWLTFALRNIHNDRVVSIDIDGLITDNKFLEPLCFRSHHEKFTVTNVELVLVFRQELKVIEWIMLVHSDDEETKLFVVFICYEIEAMIFFVVNNFLNDSNIEPLIQINFNLSFDVLINTIFLWRDDHHVLFLIHLEEFWLTHQWIFEFINGVNGIFIVVNFDNPVLFHENQACRILSFWCFFKVKLHANFVHYWNFFDNNSFV